DQRNQQQKPHSQNHGKRIESLAHESKDAGHTAAALIARSVPDGVERIAQLHHHRGRSECQCHKAEEGGNETRPGLVGVSNCLLNGLSFIAPNQIPDFPEELPLGRIFSKDKRGNPDDDNQKRGEREQGVEGERSAEPRRVVVTPFAYTLSDECEDLLEPQPEKLPDMPPRVAYAVRVACWTFLSHANNLHLY